METWIIVPQLEKARIEKNYKLPNKKHNIFNTAKKNKEKYTSSIAQIIDFFSCTILM
jgi:hypothetical protein